MSAWPTLPTFSDLTPVEESDLNALVEALEWLHSPPTCVVVTSISEIVPDATTTPLTVDAEVIDTDSMHSGGAPTRITFNTAGKFRVHASINWQAAAGGVVRACEIFLNGTDKIANVDHPSLGAATEVGQNCSVTRAFDVGDYVEVYGYQDSGGMLNADGALEAIWQAA